MNSPLVPETAARTIELLTDNYSFVATHDELTSRNPLGWPEYERSLRAARERASGNESVVTGRATVSGHDVEIAVFDFTFIAGSMGEVAGERLARSLERAAARRVPFLVVTSTGGARMQEGMVSLVQMPKVVAARIGFSTWKCPLIAVLEHPTTGGVLASIAAVADVTAAVDGATIGFAGPRVVARFAGASPPPSSHTARAAFQSGLVDALISRSERKSWLTRVLSTLATEDSDSAAARSAPATSLSSTTQGERSQGPPAPQLIDAIADNVVQLRGDRAGGDDRALVTVLARCAGHRTLILGLDRRFVPGPRAFRKTVRALRVAARLGLPVITLIDTRGADPSPPAETGGVAWAIAETMEALLSAPVPVVALVTGDGGSGGALALAAGDVLLAYESSTFTVIDPAAAAEILWRDPTRGPEAAAMLKLGAADLVALGIADGIVPDPPGRETLLPVLAYHLDRLTTDGRSGEQRAEDRRRRWRQLRGSKP